MTWNRFWLVATVMMLAGLMSDVPTTIMVLGVICTGIVIVGALASMEWSRFWVAVTILMLVGLCMNFFVTVYIIGLICLLIVIAGIMAMCRPY